MIANGFRYLPEYLPPRLQADLTATVLAATTAAPFFTPCMPRTGAPLSVAMTNLGVLGWLSDQAGGYRYEPRHPNTGAPWPPIPAVLMALWDELAGYPAPPEACLVNLYRGAARMGLHVDSDEAALDAPVVSVSLGDTAIFRIGGRQRRDPTASLTLRSGDVVVMGGESRHCFHGVDRILAGSSRLIPDGGRINLTLRRVTPP